MAKMKKSGTRKPASQWPETDMVPDEIRGNAQRGAWKKGWEAARKGKTGRSNPYDPAAATYARGLYRLWQAGFTAGRKG